MHLPRLSPNDDIRQIGFNDAARGHTACPFGSPDEAAAWAEGYDSNPDAKLPRFGAIQKKKRR